jgi:hypothetical protein
LLPSKSSLQQVFAFIEEPLTDKAISKVKVHTDRIGRYRKFFSEADINKITEKAGKAMKQFGYC